MGQADVFVVYMTYPNSVKAPREIKPGSDSSLDRLQRLHFTSPLQGQYVAARTAEVKRLSAPQQKQLMFPNNQGLVGDFYCRYDTVREYGETVSISSSYSIFMIFFLPIVNVETFNWHFNCCRSHVDHLTEIGICLFISTLTIQKKDGGWVFFFNLRKMKCGKWEKYYHI